jgi:thioredoxin reductase (NADPH)
MTIEKVIIIGSGPAGSTAAIYAARANLNPTMIMGGQPGGQLTQTHDIENWPGEESISGYDLMEKMNNHAKKLGTKIVNDEIVSVDFTQRPFVLHGASKEYLAESVIIATGANPKYLNLESETHFRGNGVSACATCDGFFYRNKDVAVIGGGNTALVEALYLSNICKKVYLVHRREEFRAEKAVISKVMDEVKKGTIELVLNATLKEILGTDMQGVTGIKLTQNEHILDIELSGVFIAIGHTPNTNVFKTQLETNNGTIVTGIHPQYSTSTSVLGVFAAGDCADENYRQAITSAGTGCKAALDAEKFLKTNC